MGKHTHAYYSTVYASLTFGPFVFSLYDFTRVGLVNIFGLMTK